jgi:hypothetical protein
MIEFLSPEIQMVIMVELTNFCNGAIVATACIESKNRFISADSSFF